VFVRLPEMRVSWDIGFGEFSLQAYLMENRFEELRLLFEKFYGRPNEPAELIDGKRSVLYRPDQVNITIKIWELEGFMGITLWKEMPFEWPEILQFVTSPENLKNLNELFNREMMGTTIQLGSNVDLIQIKEIVADEMKKLPYTIPVIYWLSSNLVIVNTDEANSDHVHVLERINGEWSHLSTFMDRIH